jgi:hypothetical protein
MNVFLRACGRVTTGAQSSADTCNQQNSQHRSGNYATHGRPLFGHRPLSTRSGTLRFQSVVMSLCDRASAPSGRLPRSGRRYGHRAEPGGACRRRHARRSPTGVGVAGVPDGRAAAPTPVAKARHEPPSEGERAAHNDEERRHYEIPGPQHVEKRQGVHSTDNGGVSAVFHPSARVANVMSRLLAVCLEIQAARRRNHQPRGAILRGGSHPQPLRHGTRKNQWLKTNGLCHQRFPV